MRPGLLVPWLGLLLVGAFAVRAEELVLGIEQSVSVQSNVFKEPDDEETDGYYDLRPSLRLLRRGRAFRYDLFYRPSLDFYFENDELNDDSHLLRGNLAYTPVPAGELTLRADAYHYSSVSAAETADADTIPDVLSGREGRVTRAFGDLAYEHRVEPDWIAAGRLGLQSYTFTNRNNVDNLGFDAEASLVHELRSNLALGGSLLGSHRRFDEEEARGLPESRNVVLNGSVVLRAEPIRTLTLEVQGGPALVLSWRDEQSGSVVSRFRGSGTGEDTVAAVLDPGRCAQIAGQFVLSSCPLEPASPAVSDRLDEQRFVDFDPGLRPGADSDTELTGFVRALLRKEESWGFASLAYSRWEEASAGITSTTVRDSLTGTLELLPGDWSLRLRANWNRRKATDRVERPAVRAVPSEFPANSFFFAEADGLIPGAESGTPEITQYWVDLRARRPVWGDRLLVEAVVRYVRQEREGIADDTAEFDDFIGTVGIRYEFRPIRFLE